MLDIAYNLTTYCIVSSLVVDNLLTLLLSSLKISAGKFAVFVRCPRPWLIWFRSFFC
jgi:hypothetical protein